MKQNREEHNWATFDISIDSRCLATNIFSKFFLLVSNEYETILINEILNHFKGVDAFIENPMTLDSFAFTKEEIEFFNKKELLDFEKFVYKFLSIFRIFLGLFLVSVTTSIYIRIALFTAPAFLHLFRNFILCLLLCFFWQS